MSEDLMESFEGPRTIRYFMLLLVGTAFLYLLGVILSEFYNIHLVESITEVLVDNPFILLNIAGLLALIVLFYKAFNFVSESDF